VSVAGITLIHYSMGDKAAEAYAMVCLVEQGWALQNEVSQAFGCSERTVRRHQRRFEAGGLAALGRPRGYPKGKPRLPSSDGNQLNGWKSGGVSIREMGRRLGISEKAVRNRLRRLGWRPEVAEQTALMTVEGADPKLSGSDASASRNDAQCTENTNNIACDEGVSAMAEGADPKLSGPAAEAPSVPLPSFDVDPADRRIDRVLACMGLLDDAAPMFGSAQRVPGAGVLLAVPALAESGVLEVAREVYGSLAPAFYGLRTTIVTFLLLALLRIKRTKGLKEHSPQQLGRLLGLDRAPEVKTLRRKLRRLAALGRAADFGRALARRRIESRGHAMGFLYVDGHVRAYHGKREIPKTHVARMRIAMPATTDYWVNDAEGDPLFVITTEANTGLVKMLPEVLEQVRELVGDRRVTVVFDRGGWSPKLFAQLLEQGFDILTYRKGKSRRVAKRHFQLEQAVIDGHEVSYWLADQGIYLFYGQTKKRKRLKLRQVTRLSNDGHQTPIVTSRRDLPSVEVAYRMFERWRQENFFKYLREEYALDALVDYGTEPADPTRSVPNPAHRQINAELRKARAELAQIQAEYGLEAIENRERLRPSMRGFKIANAKIARRVKDALKRVTDLEAKRTRVPTRVPVQEISEGEVIKLDTERKLLTDLLKMVAYQAESDLVRLITPHFSRVEDEGRTLVQNALATTGNIEVVDKELRIHLEPLSAPRRTKALLALCEQVNATDTIYPGTDLRMRFDVQPGPPVSLAFPGSPGTAELSSLPKPDTPVRG
jgi:transposase